MFLKVILFKSKDMYFVKNLKSLLTFVIYDNSLSLLSMIQTKPLKFICANAVLKIASANQEVPATSGL